MCADSVKQNKSDSGVEDPPDAADDADAGIEPTAAPETDAGDTPIEVVLTDNDFTFLNELRQKSGSGKALDFTLFEGERGPEAGSSVATDPRTDARERRERSLIDSLTAKLGNLENVSPEQIEAMVLRLLKLPEGTKVHVDREKQSFGYSTTKTDSNGTTTETVVTFNGAERSKNETVKVTNKKGELVSESSKTSSGDGSSFTETRRFDEGKLSQHVRQYDNKYNTYRYVVDYDANGKIDGIRTQGRRDSGEQIGGLGSIREHEDFEAYKKKIGPEGEALLKLAGSGEEIFGYLVIRSLGDGNPDAGMQKLLRFGPNAEQALSRLKQFGSGDVQEGVERLKRAGEGDLEKGVKLLTKLGSGDLLKGMDRLEHLGSRTGNAGIGLDNLKNLGRVWMLAGWTMEDGIANLEKIAQGNGYKTMDEAIKFLDIMGGGAPEKTISALIQLGDGSATRVHDYAMRLGRRPNSEGEDQWVTAKRGYDLLVKHMADGGILADAVKNLSGLDKDKAIEGAIARLERLHAGGPEGSVHELKRMGTGRDGKEKFGDGVQAFNQFDGQPPGSEHDPDKAEQNFVRFSTHMVNGKPTYDMSFGVTQGLALTRDENGTVDGLEIAPNIASLDDHGNNFDVGMNILARASDNGLPGEGVSGILAAGDNGTLDSAKQNLRLAATDRTVADGVEKVRGFADNRDSYTGGLKNLRKVDPNGTMRQRIQDIIDFDNTDDGVRNFEGGTANVRLVNPNGTIGENIDDVANFGDAGDDGVRVFREGTANLVVVNPQGQMSDRIRSVIAASDTVNGEQTFAGGTANVRRVDENGLIRDNIGHIIGFDDKAGGLTFDGGIANLRLVGPDRPLSQNIESVKAFGDNGTFVGGTENLKRVNPEREISNNIQSVISFGDVGADGQRTFDGGRQNLQLINPTDRISANIDRVIGFSDTSTSGQRSFDGGRDNLQRVNPSAQLSANIGSVINFGDKDANGQRTWDSAVSNLQAINQRGQMSSNIDTVISFGDSVNGVRTFDGGRQNIQAVDANGTIRDNITTVARFSDKPNATFSDGAQTLARMANPDGQMSGAIRNVQSLSNDGTFSGGTQVMRNAGGGSIERTIAGMQALAPGDMSRAVEVVKAAGQGSAEKGFEAIRQLGNSDFAAGVQRLQQAVPNITAAQIQALAAAGNGRLDVGLTRMQQAGGIDKLVADNGASKRDVSATSAAVQGLVPSVLRTGGTSGTSGTYDDTTERRDTLIKTTATAASGLSGTADDDNQSDERDDDLRYVHTADHRYPVAAPAAVLADGSSSPGDPYKRFSFVNGQQFIASLARSSLSGSLPGAAPDGDASASALRARDAQHKAMPLKFQLSTAQAQEFVAQLARMTDAVGARYLGSVAVEAARMALALKLAGAVGGERNPLGDRNYFVNHFVSGAVGFDPAKLVHLTITSGSLARLSANESRQHIASAAQVKEMLIQAHRAGVAAHIADMEKAQRQQLIAALEAGGRGIKGYDGSPSSISASVTRIGKHGALISLTPGGGIAGGLAFDVRIGRYPISGYVDIANGRTPQFVYNGGLTKRGKKLPLIGPEIALAALLISAGVARARGGAADKAGLVADKAAADSAGQPQLQAAELAAAAEALSRKSVDDDDDAKSKVHKYDPRIRPTWLVRPGEDLCKLAAHLFHDAKLGWLIADVNAANIKEMFDGRKRIIELYVRQKIELPVWQDIVEFHKLKNNFNVDDLITVVSDTAIEKELMQTMQATLAPVIGVVSTQQPVPATAGAAFAGHPAPQMVSAAAQFAAPQVVMATFLDGTKRGRPAWARSPALIELPALNAARLTADVTLTDKQDPTAVATVTDEAPAPNLKPKYA